MDAPFRIETARLFGVAPMDKLFEQAPKIIEEAAKSPLGLLALMIMALSILALFFFRKASPRIRVGIFLVVFVGFLLLGAALYRVILPGRDRGSESPRPQPNCKVVKLQRLPTIPVDVDHLGDWVVAWLKEFYNAQIIIDKGSLQGTKEGDYFFVIEEENEIKSNEGQSLGLLQERGSLVEVVEVHPEFSTCKLSQFAYESHFKGLEAKVEKAADKDGNIDSEKIAGLLAPITVGQKVIAVPREEKALWDEIEEAYNQTLADGIKDEEKKIRYQDMIKKVDVFLLEHGNGYFAPDALFEKGFAQFQLQKYDESINTFEQFRKRYPFHPSARGAEEWIEKATKAVSEERNVRK